MAVDMVCRMILDEEIDSNHDNLQRRSLSFLCYLFAGMSSAEGLKNSLTASKSGERRRIRFVICRLKFHIPRLWAFLRDGGIKCPEVEAITSP